MKFADFAELHRDVQRIFRLHQLALIDRAFDEAGDRLSDFANALARHAHDEETFVYPAYALVGAKKGADLDALTAEHHKLDDLLRRVVGEYGALPRKPSAEEILELLEREHALASLTEHHFLREENVVFPALDAELDPNERERILARCAHGATIPADAMTPPAPPPVM